MAAFISRLISGSKILNLIATLSDYYFLLIQSETMPRERRKLFTAEFSISPKASDSDTSEGESWLMTHEILF